MSLGPVEKLNRALRENRPDDYVSELHTSVGMQPKSFEEGTSSWTWTATLDRCLNPFGFVAGGYLSLFADELLASAVGSKLTEGEFATTADLRMSFLRPARAGLLNGTGKVIHRGRQSAVVDAEIFDEREKLVARATSTWIISTSLN